MPRWFASAGTAACEPAHHAALELLVAAHAGTLFRVAYTVLRDRAAAEDCVQDALLRATQHADQLAVLAEPRAWLIRIVWNASLDRRRRKRPDQADDMFLAALVSRDTPADQRLDEGRRLAATLAELDRLPRAEREAVTLSALHELTPTDIAAALGKTPSATRALLHRARTRLRERLARKGFA